MPRFHNYYTYITTNLSRHSLYTGVTNDLQRRLEEHKADAVSAKKTFAGKYNCTVLVYFEYYSDIKEAIAREKMIKLLNRSKKIDLINFFNPEWIDLTHEEDGRPVWTLEMEENRPW